VRIGPNIVMIDDPRFLPAVFHKDADRPPFKDAEILGMEGTAVGAKSSAEHKKARRKVALAVCNLTKLSPLLLSFLFILTRPT
jgi:hypothetical protein